MPTLAELQEKRNTLAAKVREIGDAFDKNGKKWQDDAQRQAWEKVNKDYDDVMSEMSQVRAADDVAKRLNALHEHDTRSVNDPGDIPGRDVPPSGSRRDRRDPEKKREVDERMKCLAMAGWCREQMGESLRRQEVEACRAIGLNPRQKQLRLRLPATHLYRSVAAEYRQHHRNRAVDKTLNSRAMSAYTLSKGGILAPDSFLHNLEINMLAFGGIREQAELIVTSGGEEMSWPTADDTTNMGERLGESTSIGSSVDPSFGAVKWNAYKYSSKAVLVPYELLEDSVFDIPSMLGSMLGERLGRKTAVDFTTGAGAAGPRGIVTAASLGKTTAGAQAILADELFDLIHSIDPAYRSNAAFMMHDNVVLYLRKLKDGDGKYIWQNGMSEGVPDRILGYPLTVSMEMASSVATGNKTILFGQLSKYKIRRVNSARLYRLEERYRDTDQDGFIMLIREDGNLLTAGTAPVKYLQQA